MTVSNKAARRRHHGLSVWQVFLRKWQLHVFMIIPVVYLILFAYVPMAGIQIAFKDFSMKKGVWGSPWAGLKHFQNFFTSFMFWR